MKGGKKVTSLALRIINGIKTYVSCILYAKSGAKKSYVAVLFEFEKLYLNNYKQNRLDFIIV